MVGLPPPACLQEGRAAGYEWWSDLRGANGDLRVVSSSLFFCDVVSLSLSGLFLSPDTPRESEPDGGSDPPP